MKFDYQDIVELLFMYILCVVCGIFAYIPIHVNILWLYIILIPAIIAIYACILAIANLNGWLND